MYLPLYFLVIHSYLLDFSFEITFLSYEMHPSQFAVVGARRRETQFFFSSQKVSIFFQAIENYFGCVCDAGWTGALWQHPDDTRPVTPDNTWPVSLALSAQNSRVQRIVIPVKENQSFALWFLVRVSLFWVFHYVSKHRFLCIY